MPTWDSAQYLKFAEERTRPAVELVTRTDVAAPRSVIDLGCGPGNSMAVLARRWPMASLTGIDSSPDMLASARRDFPQWTWIERDIGDWSQAVGDGQFDVVFANASLQWVPDHAELFPRLLSAVAPGGALAVQLPANWQAPTHRVMRELADSPAWRSRLTSRPRDWYVHPPDFYYDVLAPLAARLDLWCTDYYHVLESVDAIVEWYRGTGLRPWLDAMPDDDSREAFVAAYRDRLAPEFARRVDGHVVLPFRRLFVIAYRAATS